MRELILRVRVSARMSLGCQFLFRHGCHRRPGCKPESAVITVSAALPRWLSGSYWLRDLPYTLIQSSAKISVWLATHGTKSSWAVFIIRYGLNLHTCPSGKPVAAAVFALMPIPSG